MGEIEAFFAAMTWWKAILLMILVAGRDKDKGKGD